MYQYSYCITTAKKIQNIAEYANEIEKCVERFNEASHKARNYKNIVLPIQYDQENMQFILESDIDLGDYPSLRPLWLLSKFLLEVNGLNKYCVNKRFLKPVVIKRIAIDNTEVELSDKDILKCLLDVYMQDDIHSAYMNRLNKELKIEINKLLKEYLAKRE